VVGFAVLDLFETVAHFTEGGEEFIPMIPWRFVAEKYLRMVSGERSFRPSWAIKRLS